MDEEEVIRILTSEAAGRIAFSFSTAETSNVTVNSVTFTVVAALIRSGRISVERVPETAPSEVSGGYNRRTNTLSHRGRLYSRFWQGVLIHEAVHAHIDKQQLMMSYVDNETASYLAEAIYFRRTGLPTARWSGICRSAQAAADSIINRGSASSAEIERIRRRIMRSPHYSELLRDACLCEDRAGMAAVYSQGDGIE